MAQNLSFKPFSQVAETGAQTVRLYGTRDFKSVFLKIYIALFVFIWIPLFPIFRDILVFFKAVPLKSAVFLNLSFYKKCDFYVIILQSVAVI